MNRYEDILRHPYPIPRARKRMSARERAAQFSPFAALTGYGDAIHETARLTEDQQMPDEDAQARLDASLQLLTEHAAQRPDVSILCFQPDERKTGGAYVTIRGQVRRVDACERLIFLTDGTRVEMDCIVAMEGAIFAVLERE